MYRLRSPLSAVFLLLSLLFRWGAAHAVPPVEAFGGLPTVSDIRISPNGKQIVMLQAAAGEMVAAVYKVGASADTRPVVLKPEHGKMRSIEWANDDRLLVWLTVAPKVPGGGQIHGWGRVLSMKADGSESTFLFTADDSFQYVVNAPSLLSTLPDDPDHILTYQLDVQQYSAGGIRTGAVLPAQKFHGASVYKVNINDGREERVEYAQRTTDEWIIDSNAAVRVRIDRDRDTVIYVRGPEGGSFSRIARYDGEDPRSAMEFWGFGTDPNKVYVTARRGSDKAGVYFYDLTAAKIGGKVFLHDRFDASSVLKDRYTDRTVGATYVEHMSKAVYWDGPYASIQKNLEGVFKGQSVSILSMSRDRNVVAILVEAPGKPGIYYLYEANARRVSPLGSSYPRLADVDLGTVTATSYKARDGLTIPAYLTLPPNREAKNLPLVVLPHGGPEVRDDQSFDWWASFYASRGYAVFQPNYRGSSGYGAKFVQAGYGEFGRKMQSDLTDGVKHLVAKGIVDPKRVCIVGGSYGGYAALAGAAFTPDVYACAVSVNGVSDLVHMMGTELKSASRDKNAFNVQYWQKWLGRAISDQDKMKMVSPARHADKVQAPVLLIHGRNDTVVSFAQSEWMAQALKEAGKPYRLIALEGEDHWLSLAESRIRILKETEAFLKKHIGG